MKIHKEFYVFLEKILNSKRIFNKDLKAFSKNAKLEAFEDDNELEPFPDDDELELFLDDDEFYPFLDDEELESFSDLEPFLDSKEFKKEEELENLINSLPSDEGELVPLELNAEELNAEELNAEELNAKELNEEVIPFPLFTDAEYKVLESYTIKDLLLYLLLHDETQLHDEIQPKLQKKEAEVEEKEVEVEEKEAKVEKKKAEVEEKEKNLSFADDENANQNSKESEESEKDIPYGDKLDLNQRETGLTDAVQTGIGKFEGLPIALAVMDFEFIGGSMGSVVGEKITRLIEYATNKSLPLIISCASGGARMQEGTFSLMQMAKISSVLLDYQLTKNLFLVSLLTSPTTGGVTASFGMLGNIIIGEPDAYIAFAGKRVIEEVMKIIVPEGVQEAEFLFEKGSLDLLVPRNLFKGVLRELFSFHGFFEK